MNEIISDQAIKQIQALPETRAISLNDYIDWFEKINLNTLIWQLLALVVFFAFRKEIKILLQNLIAKVPLLKSLGGAEFELSPETEKVLEENSQKLQKEVIAYQGVTKTDPNIVFLTIYIDMESALLELYSFAFPNDRETFLQSNTRRLIRKLVEGDFLGPEVQSIHEDIRPLRNRVAHGDKPLKDFDEAQHYLKALLLLKDKISEALNKIISERTNS